MMDSIIVMTQIGSLWNMIKHFCFQVKEPCTFPNCTYGNESEGVFFLLLCGRFFNLFFFVHREKKKPKMLSCPHCTIVSPLIILRSSQTELKLKVDKDDVENHRHDPNWITTIYECNTCLKKYRQKSKKPCTVANCAYGHHVSDLIEVIEDYQ
jgi:hypothetical protein